MKQYKTALLALEQDATPNSKQNKFAKISLESQDDVLKELTKRVAKMYSYYIVKGFRSFKMDDPRRGVIPINYDEWREMQRLLNTELRAYLELRLLDEKPEWMVMAEKNGWRPY
jgi:hypothetical protein